MNRDRLLRFAFLAALLATSRAAAETPYGCDPSAIRWTLPGNFNDARERARKERRLIVIKGIAFGVDEAGAKCATKGDW